mmetsp:Transcript_36911/g.88890  ORF Transcript_36911/g.88890 Transcript_36911/m.88890 type:complete len:112 (+) Transcript_36911:55-390(+)
MLAQRCVFATAVGYVAMTLAGCGSSCTFVDGNGDKLTETDVGSGCCSALKANPDSHPDKWCNQGAVCSSCPTSKNGKASDLGHLACALPCNTASNVTQTSTPSSSGEQVLA